MHLLFNQYSIKQQIKKEEILLMSVIASNCIQICNSPTNGSKSKMLYTFPKASRFNIQNRAMCQTFYQTNHKWPRRATNFGYGNKYDFTTEAPVSPPPNTYEINSDFSPQKRKGFGFGSGRLEMQVTGPLVETLKNKNPGPGSYHIPSSLERVSYSMGKKYLKDDIWKKSIPGPGKYEVPNSINEKGTYFLSKFKNSKVPSISMLKRKDLNFRNVPGPGAYESYDNTSSEGTYTSSKHMNSGARHFAKENRPNMVQKLKTPGPGEYKLPSEFGHYQSSKIRTENKENAPL